MDIGVIGWVGLILVGGVALLVAAFVGSVLWNMWDRRRVAALFEGQDARLDDPLIVGPLVIDRRFGAAMARELGAVSLAERLLDDDAEFGPWEVLMVWEPEMWPSCRFFGDDDDFEAQLSISLTEPVQAPSFVLAFDCGECGRRFEGEALELEEQVELSGEPGCWGGIIEQRARCPQGHEVFPAAMTKVN